MAPEGRDSRLSVSRADVTLSLSASIDIDIIHDSGSHWRDRPF